MKTSKLYPFFHIICVAAFIMASCSDDAVEPQKVDVEQDAEVDDLQYSDDALIDYVMSQFAELDENGNLIERTTYFRQMDESDSTAIYTCTATLADARQRFLSLVPESYQKKIIVKNDSAEMSLPMGTSPLVLKYKEGSTDANVLATVQLPSQGAYTKIANTLTMVQSFGENADIDKSAYIGKFVKKHVCITTGSYVYPFVFDNITKDENYMVDKTWGDVDMLCYNVTDDGVAQYIYVHPIGEESKQLDLYEEFTYDYDKNDYEGESRERILGGFYPWFCTYNSMPMAGDKFESRVEELKKLLPSARKVREFLGSVSNLWKKKNLIAENYKSKWFDEEKYKELKALSKRNQDQENTYQYYQHLENLFSEQKDNDVPRQVLTLFQNFPYFKQSYYNIDKKSYIPEFIKNKANKDKPFFVPDHKRFEKKPTATWSNEEWNYLKDYLSIATSDVYDRDEDGNYHFVSTTYNSGYNEWEIVDLRVFQAYFDVLYTGKGKYEFIKMGRPIKKDKVFPLRVIRLYEEKIEAAAQ